MEFLKARKTCLELVKTVEDKSSISMTLFPRDTETGYLQVRGYANKDIFYSPLLNPYKPENNRLINGDEENINKLLENDLFKSLTAEGFDKRVIEGVQSIKTGVNQ